MKQAGYKFKVVPSLVRESHPRGISPGRLVRTLALQKAISVSKNNPDADVLGADTVVFVGGKIIGKPKNPKDAEKILKRQSGRCQRVYTGVALVWAGGKKKVSGVAVSKVFLRPLSPKDIAWAIRHHLDKAGSYAVQQRNDPFVKRIIGDYDNVVGLPMRLVKRLISQRAERARKERDRTSMSGSFAPANR